MAHFGVNYQNVCLSESPTSSLGCKMPVEEILIASTAPRHWTASSSPPSPIGPRLLVQLAGSPPPWALGGHTSGAGAPDTACCVHRASVSWNKRNTVNLLGSSTSNSSKGLGWSVAEGLWQTGNEPNGQLDQKRSPRQRQRSGAGLQQVTTTARWLHPETCSSRAREGQPELGAWSWWAWHGQGAQGDDVTAGPGRGRVSPRARW